MRTAASTLRTLRARLPASRLGWVQLVTGVVLAAVVVAAIAHELRPILAHARGFGRHDWDRAESHRYLVQKAILRFHELPLWNPYACGGFSAWGAFEGDPVVVAPWLPAYLLLALPVAIRVEVVASTLWGALGAWLLASRFTRSQAARAFVAVLFVVNSRWTLQLAAGHTAHLVYAWMPWALFLFDRAVGAQAALGPPRPWSAAWTGASLAMMVYTGGLVPLSHTVIALACYAALLSATTRSARPLGVLALAGLVTVGLAAPKLFPILDVARRFPSAARDGAHALDPEKLMQLLTNPVQSFKESYAGIPDSSWPDAGMYIGWPALLLLVAGFVAGRGPRVTPLKAIALAFLVLGVGSFAPYAPWTLLRALPVLASQHVPYAWLVPAGLLLSCVAVAAGEDALARTGRARAVLEVALTALVVWIARDVASTARQPLLDQMHSEGPKTADSLADFHTEEKLPARLAYQPGEARPGVLPAEMANVGVIECDTFEGLANTHGQGSGEPDGRVMGLGARGLGEAGYRGETSLPTGHGTSRFGRWSPSSFDVRVEGAQPGDELVVNQNWDPGWTVDGARALQHDGALAARVTAPSQTLTFRYRPRLAWLGVATLLLTLGALFVAPRLLRRYWKASLGKRTT